MIEYEELRIRAFKTGTRRYLMLANGPAAGAAAVVTLEKPAVEYRSTLQELLRQEFGGQSGPRGQGAAVRQLGRELFQIPLPNAIRGCLLDSLRWAQQNAHRLRVRFDVDPELMDLPFELICSPALDPLGAAALQPAISLARSLPGLPLSSQRTPQADDPRAWFPLLVVAPAPAGREALDVRGELERIKAARPPFLSRKVDFLHVLGSPDPGSPRPTKKHVGGLLKSRGDRPCAVLVIAHGEPRNGEIVVALERENGQPDLIPARVLAELLAQAEGLRLVILNLCLGSQGVCGEPFSGLAQALIAAGVPAVVAMQAAISDHAAVELSAALLGSLWRNQSIDEAVSDARQAVAGALRTRSEWGSPVLFLHRSCRQGWLFKVPGLDTQDPLAEERAVLERLNTAPCIEDMVRGAHSLRGRGEWSQVTEVASFLGLERPQDADQYRSLVLEAETELRVQEVEAICDALALEREDTTLGAKLDALRNAVPSQVLKVLTDEIEQAGLLLQRYHEALDAERREDWAEAVKLAQSILLLRPEGYRDVGERLEQAQTELALATLFGDAEKALLEASWDQALIRFRAILVQHPQGYKDAAAAAAYAEGRLAERQEAWAEARQLYESLLARARSYRDSKEREAYAQGREAEQGGRWREAAKAYHPLKATFEDIKERRPYAQARDAEADGLWGEAARRFGALHDYRDAQQREAYALGRLAGERGDWQGLLDAFGSLPLADEDREGDVGRWRGFARAKLAEAAESWTGVVEALRDLSADFLGGETAALHSYAEGRQAEACEDWGRAAAAFELVRGDYRDARTRMAYAQGRSAEERGLWAEAAAAFSSLPQTWREDVAPRGFYAEGRAAEERREWTAAAAAYRLLNPGYADAAQRLPSARVRQALQQGDWAGAVAEAAPLPLEPGDTGRLLAYARGRLAEEREDWPEAAAFYERCAGFADAAARQGYAQGRAAEDQGELSRALALWAPLPPGHGDAGERGARLRHILQDAPWCDGLAGARLAADPLASDPGLLPYAALREAGIHPGSPVEAIKDASFVLMEKGAMSPEARLAWDRLRSLEGRLRVDAVLYRLDDPDGLRRVLRQPVPTSGFVEALGRALPGDAPLFLLLAHRRGDAIAGWEALLTEDPSRAAAAHGLAVAHSSRAREFESKGAWEQAESAWKLAFAHWALVLSDDAWWDNWRRERAESYEQPVTPADAARLRSELGQQLLDHLTACADRSTAEGRSEREERYRGLILTLEVELEGARLLKEAGGLPLDESGGRTLVCGPLYLAHRNLGVRLGRRVAELEAAGAGQGREDLLTALDAALGAEELSGEEPGVSSGTLFRLRCTFSELGRPFLLLQGHQPEEALRALPPIHRARLADLPEEGAGPGDADFARSNPSYLVLPHRSARRLQDAVELAVRAWLDLAQAALTAGGGGLDEAFRCWQEAIEVSRGAGSQVRTKRAIVRLVLGRAKALSQERGSRRGERLSAAIELVEQARRLVGGADEGQLAALAATLLTDRGVWYGYGCHEWTNPDYEKAAGDLRRALELTPDSLHARDNLSRALIFQAANLQGERESPGPFAPLAEAIGVLHEGLRRTAGHRQLLEMLRRGLDELEECILYELSDEDLAGRIARTDGTRAAAGESDAEKARQLEATAARRRAQGDLTGELMALITAVRRDAGDDAIRRSLLDAVQRRAGLAS
jgi:hypothetical protein